MLLKVSLLSLLSISLFVHSIACSNHDQLIAFQTNKNTVRPSYMKLQLVDNSNLNNDVDQKRSISQPRFNWLISEHDRRSYFKVIGGFTALLNTESSIAAQTTGEAIRRTAANLPGYGQADVYYPSSFVGKWKATRVIVAYSDIDDIIKIPESKLPLTLSYDVRFVTVDGDQYDIDETKIKNSNDYKSKGTIEKVVADRQFNEESYYKALIEALGKGDTNVSSNNTLSSLPLIRSTSWITSNPNVLSINYNNGSSKEVKVTKRAMELDESNGIISSSEYRRITTIGSPSSSSQIVGGVPSISASRILNKWKINDNGIVEGIEIVYADGVLGDPLMAATANKSQQQLTSKSRLRLER